MTGERAETPRNRHLRPRTQSACSTQKPEIKLPWRAYESVGAYVLEAVASVLLPNSWLLANPSNIGMSDPNENFRTSSFLGHIPEPPCRSRFRVRCSFSLSTSPSQLQFRSSTLPSVVQTHRGQLRGLFRLFAEA